MKAAPPPIPSLKELLAVPAAPGEVWPATPFKMLPVPPEPAVAVPPVPALPAVQPDAPAVDTEENILATVESFDSAFANDPLAAKSREFGNTARAFADPSDATPRYVNMGSMLHDIMVAEHNLAPSRYDRAKFMMKRESHLPIAIATEVEQSGAHFSSRIGDSSTEKATLDGWLLPQWTRPPLFSHIPRRVKSDIHDFLKAFEELALSRDLVARRSRHSSSTVSEWAKQ